VRIGPSSDGDTEQLGIYFRSVQELFRVVEKRQEFMKIEVTVNLLEVYNEEIHDLLVDKGAQQSLEIRRDGHKIFIPGLSTVPVASAKEVMDVLQQGNSNRAVTSTAMNAQSSRSHSLLIVNVATSSTLAGEVEMVTKSAALTLVDLAGSERLSKSQVTGQARKEAQHINLSLSALADVMAAAASKQAHIPYRNSKLTALLQESLGGDSKTLMLVHCRPTADNIAETLCTLNFATRVRAVELGPPKARSKGPPKEAPADKANASQRTRPKRGARQP
jgi:kinesin family protein C2/C3